MNSKSHRMLAAATTLALALATPATAPFAATRIQPAVPTAEQAPIALLVDLNSGQTLFAREADRRFVPASITKAMTTFLAFEKMAAGNLRARQVVPVREETFRRWRGQGSTMFLNRGDRVAIDVLLHGVTTLSANDGSVVLAEGASGSVQAWLDEMNLTAREIGMHDSHFGSPNGFPDEGMTWVTAQDLAILAEAMIRRHPDRFHHFVGQKDFEYGGIRQPNHDPLIGNVMGADGIKTGFTYQAGYGFLGTAERDGRRLVMIVAGSDSGRIRNRAATAFMEWGFAAFDSHKLFEAGELVANAEVQGGAQLEVGLVAGRQIGVAFPKGKTGKISLAIEYEGPLKAPIAKGERVARLRIRANGSDSSVPLFAADDVKRASGMRRALNGIVGWIR